ncbi:MAG: Holliday junction branch migration protein RuvA [Pseudomonadota bacterium]
MISFVRGRISGKQAPTVVLDVGGIGYDIETPMSTFLTLPAVGSDVQLLTHFLVREDAQLLYGFSTDGERALFRNLLKVSGVGARIALAILSGISVSGFRRCVEYEDVPALVKVPGIGKKTAERLIVEMRDKLGDANVATKTSQPVSAPESGRGEAYSALLALGYRDTEVRKLLQVVEQSGEASSTEDYIRLALKQAVG